MNELLRAALAGLEEYSRTAELREPASRRLAFRELGLSIGLYAVTRMRTSPEHTRGFARYARLRSEIDSFWVLAENQRASSWREHLDINEVMLATSLAPDGFLVLPAR